MTRPTLITKPMRTSVRVINLVLSLVLVAVITWVATKLSLPSFEGGRLTVSMGFVLLAASLGGGLAAVAGLPRLTGFLLVGIVATLVGLPVLFTGLDRLERAQELQREADEVPVVHHRL